MVFQPPALATTSTPASPTTKRQQFTLPCISVANNSSSIITQAQRNKQAACNATEKKSKAPRRKLGPGCGLLDWIRLCRSKKDLAGNGGVPRPVTEEELAKHNTPDDAWTAIRGIYAYMCVCRWVYANICMYIKLSCNHVGIR